MPENDYFQLPDGKQDLSQGQLVAIKKQKNVLNLNGLEFFLLREIKLLQELNHPNIVKLHDVFHLNGLLYFALEYGEIDLADLIKDRETVIF